MRERMQMNLWLGLAQALNLLRDASDGLQQQKRSEYATRWHRDHGMSNALDIKRRNHIQKSIDLNGDASCEARATSSHATPTVE